MADNSSLRVIFAGTPTFAAQQLKALLGSPHRVVAVYTQPDRPAGRGKRLSPSPVKEIALANSIEVLQPPSLKTDAAQQQLRALNADIMVVVAYGLILPQRVLDMPRLGCVNVHASLLPRWRGAAPVQRAIEAGDTETGITIMQMDAGLDTGPMLLKVRCDINPQDCADDVLQKLSELGSPALLQVLDQAASGTLRAEVQDDAQACYASKIDKAEAKIDWQQSATTIERKVRAFNPFPVAFTELDDQRIKIYHTSVIPQSSEKAPGTIVNLENNAIAVACGEQTLAITALQMPGKKVLASADVLRGYSQRFSVGTQFS